MVVVAQPDRVVCTPFFVYKSIREKVKLLGILKIGNGNMQNISKLLLKVSKFEENEVRKLHALCKVITCNINKAMQSNLDEFLLLPLLLQWLLIYLVAKKQEIKRKQKIMKIFYGFKSLVKVFGLENLTNCPRFYCSS